MTAPLQETTLAERLAAFEGREVGPPSTAPDAVNQAMIRHWVEAMGDDNPVYVDEGAARAAGFTGIVTPATMLQAWVMRGYKATMEAERARGTGAHGTGANAQDELFALLDEAGFTSVVATDCEQDYLRPLVLGDLLTVSSVIEAVSAEKRTALGDGHFVTTRLDFTDEGGVRVATMRFRILRFRPKPRAEASARLAGEAPVVAGGAPTVAGEALAHIAPPRAVRPRPALTQDTSFFFDGVTEGRLLIQRCASCGVLRHPPRPSCPECRSLEWDTLTSTGRGVVYSYVIVHHPRIPSFDYPLPIALVELEEGTRLVADLVDVDPDEVRIGMPVEVQMVAVDEGLTLPMFRPAVREGN